LERIVTIIDPELIFLRLLAEKADDRIQRFDLAGNGGLQPKSSRPAPAHFLRRRWWQSRTTFSVGRVVS
jgi:hypothetical protein